MTEADAIVVLGGGIDTRPFAAIKLYQAKMAPKILYMNVKPTPAQKMGLYLSEAEETRRIFLGGNIPETAVEAIGTNVASTYDESRTVRAWVNQTGKHSIIIVTDIFHTRRARWIFEKQLKGTDTKIQIQGVEPLDYNADNWWQHEEGVIAFQNEVVKFAYYWIEH